VENTKTDGIYTINGCYNLYAMLCYDCINCCLIFSTNQHNFYDIPNLLQYWKLSM